jgi:hypothetical protein
VTDSFHQTDEMETMAKKTQRYAKNVMICAYFILFFKPPQRIGVWLPLMGPGKMHV